MGWQPETQPKGKPPKKAYIHVPRKNGKTMFIKKTKGAETMQRLIDANALLKDIEKLQPWIVRNSDNSKWSEGFTSDQVMFTIDAQPTVDAKPQWIPCKERLPKIGTNVLITNDKGNVSYGRYRGVYPIDDNRIWWAWKKNTLENVLAWMPLPKPYEVKE